MIRRSVFALVLAVLAGALLFAQGGGPTLPTRVTQERAPAPSSSTVQAPHCPSPQP